MELEPDDHYAYNGRGKVYTAKGEFDSAIKDYTTAIQLKPDHAKAYYNRGGVWLHLRKWEEAKSDLTTAKNIKANIIAVFPNQYASIEDFEQKTGIQLPKDIVEMLTQQ